MELITQIAQENFITGAILAGTACLLGHGIRIILELIKK